jgi:hypothetical protein
MFANINQKNLGVALVDHEDHTTVNLQLELGACPALLTFAPCR